MPGPFTAPATMAFATSADRYLLVNHLHNLPAAGAAPLDCQHGIVEGGHHLTRGMGEARCLDTVGGPCFGVPGIDLGELALRLRQEPQCQIGFTPSATMAPSMVWASAPRGGVIAS